MSDFEPRIVCFCCSFGWGYQGDRQVLQATVPYWLPVACSGKIETEQVLEALRSGADGILILGCPENECHFQDGNHQLRKRMELLKKVLSAHGIEPERLAMIFDRDPAGTRVPELVAAMADRVRPLGPRRLPPGGWGGGDDEC